MSWICQMSPCAHVIYGGCQMSSLALEIAQNICEANQSVYSFYNKWGAWDKIDTFSLLISTHFSLKAVSNRRVLVRQSHVFHAGERDAAEQKIRIKGISIGILEQMFLHLKFTKLKASYAVDAAKQIRKGKTWKDKEDCPTPCAAVSSTRI